MTGAPNQAARQSLMARLREAGDPKVTGTSDADDELSVLWSIWVNRGEADSDWLSSVEPYQYLGHRLLNLGAAPLAKDVAGTALDYVIRNSTGAEQRPWSNDIELRLILGLSMARTANPEQAQEVLGTLYKELGMDQERSLSEGEMHVWNETLGMLARTYKDQAGVADPAMRDELWQQSLNLYEKGYRLTGSYWPGINVATLARLRGNESRARHAAQDVQRQCLPILESLPAKHHERYWVLATLGEAALVQGDLDNAASFYNKAYQDAPRAYGHLNSTRRHAKWLLEHLQQSSEVLDQWLPIPKVVVFAGHMIDREDRQSPRFPAQLEQPVFEAIRNWLHEQNALVGFSSAACGSDIVFQEALRELGGERHVVLPYDEELFVEDSVAFAGESWRSRFNEVLKNAAQVTRASSGRLMFGGVSYQFANELLHGLATRRAVELETSLIALAVWDGRSGDGVGGTSTAVARWNELSVPVFHLDVTQKTPHRVLPNALTVGKDFISHPTVDLHGSVAALLFADAVGFAKLTDAEVPLFVREFLGGVAQLLEQFEVSEASSVTDRHGAVDSPSKPVKWGDLNWTRRIPVRETRGDGVFLVFPSPKMAGKFALELLQMVKRTDWLSRGFSEPLKVRIALHAGPVYPITDPVTGLPTVMGAHISRAARLEPKTPPGEIYASEAFAAMLALEDDQDFVCDYVKQLAWAKEYGTFPTYVVRNRF